jgi:hypothetical protein
MMMAPKLNPSHPMHLKSVIRLKHIKTIDRHTFCSSVAVFGVPFHVKCHGHVPCRSRLMAVQHANAPRHKGLHGRHGLIAGWLDSNSDFCRHTVELPSSNKPII